MVASDIAGYRNIVRDGLNGMHVPPSDPHTLSGQCPRQHEGRARPAPTRSTRSSPEAHPAIPLAPVAAGGRPYV
jgi:hypothetical protein